MLNKEFVQEFIKFINEYKTINIFCHLNPDYDTLGSAYGLKEFLKINFPFKNINIVNTNKIKNIENSKLLTFDTQETTIDDIDNGLGIIVDVNSHERVLGSELLEFCKQIIVIDHHILDHEIKHFHWIEQEYPACCQMVAELIKYLHDHEHLKINEICLTYLYAGLLTDTNRFLYDSVQPSTYKIMSWLAEHNINRNLVHDELYLHSIKEAKLKAKFLNLVKINSFGVGSLLITKKYNKKYKKTSFSYAVSIMEGFKEILVWVSCYFNQETKTWNCSLRSRKYPVVEVARKYQGGGHKLAAGCRINSAKEFKNIVNDLTDLIKKYDNSENI